MSKTIDSEHMEQVTFVNWFRENVNGFVFAIPNGELRNITVAKRLKAEGVVSGVPDLCCILPNGLIIWIEMKKKKNGRVSKEQKEIHSIFNAHGQKVHVCNGWEEAAALFLD